MKKNYKFKNDNFEPNLPSSIKLGDVAGISLDEKDNIYLFNRGENPIIVINQNGELINYIHIYFEWDQVPSAISYNVQASNQQSFNNLILNIEENSTAYIDKDNFNWNNNYFWRVRPIYNDGQFGNWISTSSFQIGSTILPNLDVYIYNDELIQDGLNMYSQFSPYVAIGVIDKNGNEIWNTQSVYMNHINQYGQLYGVNGQGVQFNYDVPINGTLKLPNFGAYRSNGQRNVWVKDFVVTSEPSSRPGLTAFKQSYLHLELTIAMDQDVFTNGQNTSEDHYFHRGVFLGQSFIMKKLTNDQSQIS